MSQGWAYMLECADGSYYVGSTSNLTQRVAQHNEGFFGGYTASRRPVRLVWSQGFQHMIEAIAAERQIKGWTRAKKQALISGDFDLLHELARSSTTKCRRK